MLYQDLTFSKANTSRPFFYTNFVQTLDGKVAVLKNSKKYWPVGSKTDWETLVELRAYADCLIHGKNTAACYPALERLGTQGFKALRKNLGKEETLPYFVISDHPDNRLYSVLKSNFGNKPFLVASEKASVPGKFEEIISLLRIGGSKVRLSGLAKFLKKQGYKNVLVEGGPHLLGEFLKEDLMDEVFVTIAPKIFGNDQNSTLTLVEGVLFPPPKIKKLKLLSAKTIQDEVYLRYKLIQPQVLL